MLTGYFAWMPSYLRPNKFGIKVSVKAAAGWVL